MSKADIFEKTFPDRFELMFQKCQAGKEFGVASTREIARDSNGSGGMGAPLSCKDTRSESIRELAQLIEEESRDGSLKVAELVTHFIETLDNGAFVEHSDILIRACSYFFRIGNSRQGIVFGNRIAESAERANNIFIQRRIYNLLGGQYTDIADFSSAMHYLQAAITLARDIGNATIEAACLANVVTVMQEMGHYRQAIDMAQKVMRLDDDSYMARMLKLQCASNGLFAAHRIGDNETANQFLDEGQKYLTPETQPLGRAFFAMDRTLYLIDSSQVILATRLVNETINSIWNERNPRVKTLLGISVALCKWASHERHEAKAMLGRLYKESKISRLYHHFVLQALIKAHSDAATSEEAGEGLAYARELVEYTTSVKKAKFYRQLSNRKTLVQESTSQHLSKMGSVDPFAVVREWLSGTDITGGLVDTSARGKRELAKHEELTAIHEDMAKLRAATLRREIRTYAVGTAENWAIAAELFDDETGQHCYRVGHLAGMLAREIGMNDTFCVQVEHAARLHDIGKIAVNEVILLKPGPLDAAEMAAMRLHTEVGGQMLADSDDPTLKMASEIARYHHEWWNGGGYPKRLSGREIPISARVCAFADVYDALTHARAYKVAWTHERALEEILRLRGVQFDPDLMDPFVKVLDRYLADLDANAIPGFADMNTNALISSRRKLMETIAAGNK